MSPQLIKSTCKRPLNRLINVEDFVDEFSGIYRIYSFNPNWQKSEHFQSTFRTKLSDIRNNSYGSR